MYPVSYWTSNHREIVKNDRNTKMRSIAVSAVNPKQSIIYEWSTIDKNDITLRKLSQ